MAGGWQTYHCDHCALVLELGGSTCWDGSGVVYARSIQVACAGCGTMHRIIEKSGACRIFALPGPVRSARKVALQDITGEAFETDVWVSESDWLPVGEHAADIGAIEQLICTRCCNIGRVLTLDDVRRRGECPVCHDPMECIAVTDEI